MTETATPPEKERALSAGTRHLLRVIGIILVPIGVAGIILPLLPGVPFLILAAACFARSSPRLEQWLVSHPVLGPGIRKWRESGAISTKSKAIAIAMMALSVFMLTQSSAPLIVKAIVIALVSGGALFVATRPSS